MLGGLAILSFVCTFLLIRLLLLRFGRVALDVPNARSLHGTPVPRTGGVALLAGAALSLAFGAAALWLPMVLALALAGLSLVDDLRGVPVAVRLVAHIACAGVFLWQARVALSPGAFVLLLLALAWLTNLYNFMDGADGLAGGMAFFGFGAYALAAHAGAALAMAALCTAIAAASAGFLVHNFHPARIFLGDVGSIPLGFLAGVLGVTGWSEGLWPLWFPLAAFGPFIVDASLTLARRALRAERVWQAHREHYYQRAVRMGLGHRRTALAAYVVMLACAAGALLARDAAPSVQAGVALCLGLLLACVAGWVDLRWKRHMRSESGAA